MPSQLYLVVTVARPNATRRGKRHAEELPINAQLQDSCVAEIVSGGSGNIRGTGSVTGQRGKGTRDHGISTIRKIIRK